MIPEGGGLLTVRPILLLGNPALYNESSAMRVDDLGDVAPVLKDLRETLLDFRARHGTGKAIAAPQIGVLKRIVYINEPGPPRFLLNPVLQLSGEQIETWEHCMSFPDLLVRTRRASACSVEYRDEEWREHKETARGDLAVITQHECDHLDGTLAVARALDGRAFCLISQRRHFARHPGVGRTVLRPNSARW